MQEEWTWLIFVEIEDSKRKTKQWYIKSKKDEPLVSHILGYIIFYPQWRKYIYKPANVNTIFDSSCLSELALFCKRQTDNWRESLKVKEKEND